MHDRGANTGALELHLKVVDHGDQCGLRGPVGAHVRALPQRHLGTHEDQVTALAFQHARQHRGRQPVGPDQMDLQLRVELVGADLGQLAEVGVTGAGDQHLDFAERVNGVGHERLHRVGVGHVEVEPDGLATFGADLADEVVELLDATGAECDREAARREFDGGGFSDACRGACDDGRSAVGKWCEAWHLDGLHGHG